jgi:uncharacterized protein (TIGR03437 family)
MKRIIGFLIWFIFGTFGSLSQDGTGPLIEQRLTELRTNAAVSKLLEIPTDQSIVPAGWLALVSWNVQVGGVSPSPDAERPPMVATALGRSFSGSFQLLAAQEVSSSTSDGVLLSLLPGADGDWASSFFDTTDSQDNGFWLQPSVGLGEAMPLFVTSAQDDSGRFITDPARSVHPPQAAHFTVGDFDFTLITVHLTFADGNTGESAREMRVILDYLDEYFQQPGHDPDVIICGDFNIPSLLSGQSGSAGIMLDSIMDGDARFQTGERRLVVTVHEPTSRTSVGNGGAPHNNYDHFVLSADALEEFIQARRVAPEILTDHPDDPEVRLTSDHFPIVAFFRTQGEGIQRDVNQALLSIDSVLNGASFAPGISTGSWVTIFGENLAPTARIWRADEIVDGLLPTELDGVQVLFNGKPAAIFFISPRQLNVQAPDDMALGPVSVEVIRGDGSRAMSMAELQAASPAFFLFDPENRRYLAAVHADGTFVGKPNLFGGAVATRPAKPGDVLLLFGTGFGPTEPAVPAGSVFSAAVPLKDSVRVLMGGIQADVLFAGLSGAGLNQLNVRVPQSVASGDVPVVAETMGFSTQDGAFLSVENPTAPPMPTITFTATPDRIQQGQSTTLQWMTSNATTVSIDQGIGGVLVDSSRVVTPTTTTTYTITATGPAGTATASVTVVVTAAPEPTVTLTASPLSIQPGQSSTLQWTSSNAAIVSLDQGIGTVVASGSRVVTPSATTTYTVTATGPGGTASQSVTVVVNAAPAPTVTLTASPQTIEAGQSTTLQWTTSNAATVSINQGIGSVNPNGSIVRSPQQTTTYTITAQGPGGMASASTTVIVTESEFGPCGSKTLCGQMESCAEAKYYLNVCKVNRLDGDGDGVPCESICPGG